MGSTGSRLGVEDEATPGGEIGLSVDIGNGGEITGGSSLRLLCLREGVYRDLSEPIVEKRLLLGRVNPSSAAGSNLSDSLLRKARSLSDGSTFELAEAELAYRGNSLELIRDITDCRRGIGDAVIYVIGASRIPRSSMFTSGLSGSSNRTSSPRCISPFVLSSA